MNEWIEPLVITILPFDVGKIDDSLIDSIDIGPKLTTDNSGFGLNGERNKLENFDDFLVVIDFGTFIEISIILSICKKKPEWTILKIWLNLNKNKKLKYFRWDSKKNYRELYDWVWSW